MINTTIRTYTEGETLNPGERIQKVYNNTYVSKQTHFGMVVYDGEHNYYHDSDFYAVVPKDGSFVEIEYGTTRFFSYGCYCKVDAPPSLTAEYLNWKIKTSRLALLVKESYYFEKLTTDMGLFVEAARNDDQKLEALEKLVKDDRWYYVLSQLAKAKKSNFRLSLQSQVLTWIENIGNENSYQFPLSQKQFLAIVEYMPRRRY